MKYSAAYLLALLGGNSSPDVAAIAKILGSVGIECDEKRAQQVIDACQGRNVEEIIANGMTKMDDVLGNVTTATTEQVPPKESSVKTEPPSKREETPPGSPGEDPTFVSSSIDLIAFTNIFSFSSAYSIKIMAFDLGKIYNKQEISSIIPSVVFISCKLFGIKYRFIQNAKQNFLLSSFVHVSRTILQQESGSNLDSVST